MRHAMRAVLVTVAGVVLASSTAGAATPAAAPCTAYEPVRRQFTAMKEAIAKGASEDDVVGPDIVGPLRTCFRTQVMPQLTRAETSDRMLGDAARDFLAWGRQAALLGAEVHLTAELAEGSTSLGRGLSHAYAVARDKCVRLNDQTQIPVMLSLMRFAQLIGYTITSEEAEDLEACLRGNAYLVQVKLHNSSTKRGVGSEYFYNALLRRAPDGDDGDLAGVGSYSGYVIAHNANCRNGAPDRPQRFTVSGELEASGALVDLAAPGARPEPNLMYVLGTTDWNLRPMWGGDGPYAETAEEKEGLKGLGTTMSGRPLKLTGRVTTFSHSAKRAEDKCAGVTTGRTDIRIVQLRGTRR